MRKRCLIVKCNSLKKCHILEPKNLAKLLDAELVKTHEFNYEKYKDHEIFIFNSFIPLYGGKFSDLEKSYVENVIKPISSAEKK